MTDQIVIRRTKEGDTFLFAIEQESKRRLDAALKHPLRESTLRVSAKNIKSYETQYGSFLEQIPSYFHLCSSLDLAWRIEDHRGKTLLSSDTVRPAGKNYLQCKIGRGLFNGEYIVTISLEGKIVSAVVGDRSVKLADRPPKTLEQEIDGYVNVSVIEKGKEKTLVSLPGEVFGSYNSFWVPAKALQPATTKA